MNKFKKFLKYTAIVVFIIFYIPGGVILYNEWSRLYAKKINIDLDVTEWTYSSANYGPFTWFIMPPIYSSSLYYKIWKDAF